MSELAVLSESTCLELLTTGTVGRVALCTPEGPQIFPVNYVVHDASVVFRTTPYSLLGAQAWQTRLAFEVDQLDHERRLGWSVLATGPGSRIDPGPTLDEVVHHWNPRPWAAGTRPLYVRLRWDALTGRRVGEA
ncbi:MAG TPA: pyridoxamine 5'-phosphate oxidase family protein [Nocardioides sp.]|uniref:pyridoxamine 5'-phosphate oxidase family protein n=1 Tax=Nocardioides sp. TaxID=35761 RepID=UPI002B775B38|nr:pyridoxamine 5'-phosphate oxidase family protein [Nocardioides sp.]HQR26774.1 pyridoxamine 5'-phosphate oxidase family protein [Nocardioides sp.]